MAQCLFPSLIFMVKYYIWLTRGEMLIIVKYCPQTIHTHTRTPYDDAKDRYIEQLKPINFVAHSYAHKQTWNNRKICAKKKWRRSGAVLFTKHKELKCIALLIKCFIVAVDVLAYQVYFKCVEMSFCLYSYLSGTMY